LTTPLNVLLAFRSIFLVFSTPVLLSWRFHVLHFSRLQNDAAFSRFAFFSPEYLIVLQLNVWHFQSLHGDVILPLPVSRFL